MNENWINSVNENWRRDRIVLRPTQLRGAENGSTIMPKSLVRDYRKIKENFNVMYFT